MNGGDWSGSENLHLRPSMLCMTVRGRSREPGIPVCRARRLSTLSFGARSGAGEDEAVETSWVRTGACPGPIGRRVGPMGVTPGNVGTGIRTGNWVDAWWKSADAQAGAGFMTAFNDSWCKTDTAGCGLQDCGGE
ncbi:unnamed protein product [Calypogeia fissa]